MEIESGGKPIDRRGFNLAAPTQVGEETDRTLRFIGTTESADRYNSVIRADGWVLENFKRNPVFLWAHKSDEPPIGRIVNIEKAGGKRDASGKTEPKKLVFDVQFAKREDYAFADVIYRLYKAGIMRATSVGFMNLEQRAVTDETELKELGLKPPMGQDLMKNELYELSAIPVPGNAEALAETAKQLEATVPGVRGILCADKRDITGDEMYERLEAIRLKLEDEKEMPLPPIVSDTVANTVPSEEWRVITKRELDELRASAELKNSQFPPGLIRSIVESVVRAAELRLLPCLAGLAKQTEIVTLNARLEDLRGMIEAKRGTMGSEPSKTSPKGASHIEHILEAEKPRLEAIAEKLRKPVK